LAISRAQIGAKQNKPTWQIHLVISRAQIGAMTSRKPVCSESDPIISTHFASSCFSFSCYL